MSLRDDLIAAKALIDTPEKWEAMPVRWALSEAVDGGGNRTARMAGALSDVDGPRDTHADIMALFDRAIAAAEPHR